MVAGKVVEMANPQRMNESVSRRRYVLSRQCFTMGRRLLIGQLAVHVEPPENDEPIVFRLAELRPIVCGPNPRPDDKKSEAGTFCFTQWCFLCTHELVRRLRFPARCNDAAYHLLFSFYIMCISCALYANFHNDVYSSSGKYVIM